MFVTLKTTAVTDRGSWGSHRDSEKEREGKEARKEERWAMFMWYKFKQQIHKEGQRRVSCHTTEITGEMQFSFQTCRVTRAFELS